MMESGKAKQMADLNMVPIELQEALWIAVSEKDREILQNMIAKGKSNRRIAIWLSALPDRQFPDCNRGMC